MLSALNELTRGFAAARSLGEIAELAVATLQVGLPERGVLVQLWSPGDSALLEAALGPEMSSEMFSIKLTMGEVPLGEITVDSQARAGRALTSEELAWIEAVASAVSAVTRERHSIRKQREAQLATVMALTRLLERRDQTIGRHFDRMRSHCRMIGEELIVRDVPGVDAEFVEDLTCACILHDIGKVAIPDSILSKPGRLSREEWELTKTHTTIGASTLEAVLIEHGNQSILELGREIALEHHERWNGGGYPRGLKGKETSLAARIVGLVDTYDALTHHRAFRTAWLHQDAIDWIERRAGDEFDPLLVDCLLAREAEIEAASLRMPDLELVAREP